MSEPETPALDAQGRRLWTPWRMQYVGGETREEGCIFCNRVRATDDVASLILHRSERSFVIMNLFPYNTGHIMLVPNEHVASPEDTDPETLAEMARLLPALLRALRRVLSCHGFNIGLNVGSVAGAGLAEHLHQHMVPRWNGDANFMPILGSAMVIPELIPVSYAKIRAELHRELAATPSPSIQIVVIDPLHGRVHLDPGGMLPTVPLTAELPVWRSAAGYLSNRGVNANVAGWAGTNRADTSAHIALTLVVNDAAISNSFEWSSIDELSATSTEDAARIRTAVAQLSPLLGRAGH